MGRIRCAVFVTLSSKHRHYDKPCDYGKSGQYCKSQSVGRCRTGRFRITQPRISLCVSQTQTGMDLVVASRSDELSNREFRGKRTAARVFSSQAVSSRVRYARSVFSVATVDRASNKTAHSAAITESDSEKNNASTYHDASICSLKRGRKLVSFFLCRMPPTLLPRCCRNASSSSTARWGPRCSGSV